MTLFSQLKSAAKLLTAAVLSLCVVATAHAKSPTLDRVLKDGVLRVGMSGSQPPFTVLDRSGNLIGYDVDLAKSLASAMDVKIELVQKPFGQLNKALLKGDIDVVLSGMSITPERSKSVSFVGPIMLSGKSVLTTQAAMDKLKGKSMDSKDSKDNNIATLSNSTSEDFVKKHMPHASLQTVSDYDQAVALLLAGKTDSIIADKPILTLTRLRNPNSGLLIMNKPLKIEAIGMAIPANDPQFQNLMETYMSTLEKTGLLNELRAKWFENGSWVAALP